MIEVTELEKSKVTPMYDRVLILPHEGHHESNSSLIIPESAKKKPTIGTIVQVGPSKEKHILDMVTSEAKFVKIEPPFKNGDKVLFTKYAGFDIKVDGISHLIVWYQDIIAIVEAS